MPLAEHSVVGLLLPCPSGENSFTGRFGAPRLQQKRLVRCWAGFPLNNPYPLGDVDAARRLALARPEAVIAHLPLHSADVDPVSAADNALLEDLLQNRFMQDVSLLRGE